MNHAAPDALDIGPTVQVHASRQIQLFWPDDDMFTGPGDDRGDLFQADPRGLASQGRPGKKLLLRPRVSVNVFSTGGSSSGGSSAGGSGTGGSGTGGAVNFGGGGTNTVSDGTPRSLTLQVEELEEKVERLSLLTQARQLVVESGLRTMTPARHLAQLRAQSEGRVNFSKEFKSIPAVSVSLSSADVCGQASFKVRVYATAIDLKGFTMHTDSWGDTKLYSCGASWIAIGE